MSAKSDRTDGESPIETPVLSGLSSPTRRVSLPSSINPNCNNNLRFLLVDDSSSILKVISRALNQRNYPVDTAENGSAGLDRLIEGYETNDFDVVLMDLQMPVMDGIEAVRRYREYENIQNIRITNEKCKEIEKNEKSEKNEKIENIENWTGMGIPSRLNIDISKRLLIIGMSANSDRATEIAALDAGMDAFLAKPFTMADLQPLVSNMLTVGLRPERRFSAASI